ncbi:MAG: hypothetical protein JWP04_3466 [Belnapia sp.]|nr:hypothetical protein [Belnapia sp.]
MTQPAIPHPPLLPPTLAEAAAALAFGALPLDEVLALREATGWRHFPGATPGRFAGLISVPVLDALLTNDAARAPRISLADAAQAGSASVPEAEYCLPDGRIDPLRLLARFDAGATLIVSQLQDLHPPLAGFCRGLEKLFLHGVQANAYLTPPGAQGFRLHYDTHDVLVLQVEGPKTWHIWPGQPLPFPTSRTPWQREMTPTEPAPVTLTLQPGEALYLPRGTLHEARGAEAAASLHLTIGLLEPSWAEALHLLLDRQEAENPALRAPFPSWRLGEAAAAPGLRTALAMRLDGLGTAPALEQLSLGLLESLAGQRMPLPGRGLLTPPPKPEARLRLADGMLHHVAALPDGSAELRWAGGRLPLTAPQLAWLEALATGATPVGLAADGGAVEFCRRLAAAGLLEPG